MTMTQRRSLRAAWQTFAERLRTRLRDQSGAFEVSQPEQLLRDVRLSMSDMPALTKSHAGPSVLLPQRLNLVGLDARYLEQADPVTLSDLQRSCLSCARWRQCARDLARDDVQAGLDGYCLNSQLIDRLLLDRSSREQPS